MIKKINTLILAILMGVILLINGAGICKAKGNNIVAVGGNSRAYTHDWLKVETKTYTNQEMLLIWKSESLMR